MRSSSHALKCADDHILFDEHMNEVFAKDLKPGDRIQTDAGIEEVLDVRDLGFDDSMYDI